MFLGLDGFVHFKLGGGTGAEVYPGSSNDALGRTLDGLAAQERGVMKTSTKALLFSAAVVMLGVVAFVVFIVAIARSIDTNGAAPSISAEGVRPPATTERATQPAVSSAAAKYTVVDEKVSDTALKTQIEQHIVVAGVPTKSGLEAEILDRYRAAQTRRGFRYHNPATNIFIYVYGSMEQARAGQGLWIGMIAKGFSDRGEPEVLINDERLAAFGKPAENRFGLSEAMRRQVFREIAAAENRGTREAMERISDSRIREQTELERQLQKEYKSAIARRYKLSEDALRKILVEGVKKGWPSR